jgi:hypothetical protein
MLLIPRRVFGVPPGWYHWERRAICLLLMFSGLFTFQQQMSDKAKCSSLHDHSLCVPSPAVLTSKMMIIRALKLLPSLHMPGFAAGKSTAGWLHWATWTHPAWAFLEGKLRRICLTGWAMGQGHKAARCCLLLPARTILLCSVSLHSPTEFLLAMGCVWTAEAEGLGAREEGMVDTTPADKPINNPELWWGLWTRVAGRGAGQSFRGTW